MGVIEILRMIAMLAELASVATTTKLDDLAAAGLKNALAELEKVRNTPVTKAQLEQLRADVKKKW